MFSIVILTLNEAQNLPSCLASTQGISDVVVLDSGSTDATATIALAAGARVVTNPFANFAQQRNFAHTSIPFAHEWILHLDADEQLSPALIAECTALAKANPSQLDGFYIAPKMMFRGKWIRRCTDFPAFQARFVHRTRFQFIQTGHGQREAPEMRMGKLTESYSHNLSAEPEDILLAKYQRYARQEAAHFVKNRHSLKHDLAALTQADPLLRRRALKALSYRLPARGLARFVYQYLLRGGIFEGAPGFAYCRLLAAYERTAAQEIRRLALL